MTLAAMWVETRDPGKPNVGKLCFASDSRTTPGPIEGVNKVLLFSRPDIAAVWAGDFRYAALLADHLDVTLSVTAHMRDRTVDVARLFRVTREWVVGHLASTTTADAKPFMVNPQAQEPERMTMLVGGYSIEQSRFVVMRIRWDPDGRRWRASVKSVDPTQISWIGDAGYCRRAKWLVSKLRARRTAEARDWHMEPLGAIDFYRQDYNVRSIGGDLQLAKAFMHGAASAYAIAEPMTEGVTVRGSRFPASIAKEFSAQNLLVDLARWSLRDAAYGSARVIG